jgi:hypothetical protein
MHTGNMYRLRNTSGYTVRNVFCLINLSVLPADIVFVVDESGSVGQIHFDDTIKAISDTVDNLVIHKDLIHVGMTLFEGHGTSH